MDTEKTAYRILSVNKDKNKTTLELQEIHPEKVLRIGLNNEDPIPYDIESGKSVSVISKVEAKNASRFLSDYASLTPYTIEDNGNSKQPPFSNQVFPLYEGDILIIEHPSLYSAIESILRGADSH